MKKDLEQLIVEYLDEHPGARIVVERDMVGELTVGRDDLRDEAGYVHTHTRTLAAGLRDLWGFAADGPDGMARQYGVQRGFGSMDEMKASRR